MRFHGFRKNVPKCQAATPSGEEGESGEEKVALPPPKIISADLDRSAYKGKAVCLEKTCFFSGTRWQGGQSSPSKEFLNKNQIVCKSVC